MILLITVVNYNVKGFIKDLKSYGNKENCLVMSLLTVFVLFSVWISLLEFDS